MNRAVATFEARYAEWSLRIPEEQVADRQPGHFTECGWLVQYRFDHDANGPYLEYYASHRMTEDIHERLYDSGKVVRCPTIVGLHETCGDAAEAARMKANHFASNRAVAESLAGLGFNKMNINMALRCGMAG